MAFKIAYGAGHYLHEAGKRLPKELDPKQTREWTLNDRVARHFAEAASQYEGVELLRTDDPTGKTEVDLQPRCDKANKFKADFALSIHHNAGANLTNAGGIVAYSYPNSKKGAEYRDAIYNACIAAGGLKGDRATPKQTANFHVLKYTTMPCVLMEYGFMDSKLDYSVILQDSYSKLVAYATMEGIAKVAGLKKKPQPAPQPAPSTEKSDASGVNVRVLRNGATGADVKAMQILLIGYGYKMQNGGKTYGADGSYGPATVNAVKAFQKDKGLTVDGECGPLTWAKLLGLN